MMFFTLLLQAKDQFLDCGKFIQVSDTLCTLFAGSHLAFLVYVSSLYGLLAVYTDYFGSRGLLSKGTEFT